MRSVTSIYTSSQQPVKYLQICQEVVELGERRAGVANELTTKLCAVWKRELEKGGEERVQRSLLSHKKLILQLCLFGSGQQRRKSMR